MNTRIYLDNNATSPMLDEVLETLLSASRTHFGNPSSIHEAGRASRDAIEHARASVARCLGARKQEVMFTSGATESTNTILRSIRDIAPDRDELVISAVEHAATKDTAELLAQRHGLKLHVIPVDSSGSLDLKALRAAVSKNTALVSIMWANNETGVIFPVAEVGAIAKEAGALFHTDGVQAVGRVPVDFKASGADYMSISAHKFHGPKGIGALLVRRGRPFEALITGGGQEDQRRSGTESVAAIVAMAKAIELAHASLNDGTTERVQALRDRLETALRSSFPEAIINGAGQPRLGNTTNVAFRHSSGEAMLQLLDEHGIAVSTSSACSSNETEPSHVLRAMMVPTTHIHGALRISLSRLTTDADIDELLQRLPAIVNKAREASTYDQANTVEDFDLARTDSQ